MFVLSHVNDDQYIGFWDGFLEKELLSQKQSGRDRLCTIAKHPNISHYLKTNVPQLCYRPGLHNQSCMLVFLFSVLCIYLFFYVSRKEEAWTWSTDGIFAFLLLSSVFSTNLVQLFSPATLCGKWWKMLNRQPTLVWGSGCLKGIWGEIKLFLKDIGVPWSLWLTVLSKESWAAVELAAGEGKVI